MRKERQLKLFEEKFTINSERVLPSEERRIQEELTKIENKTNITYKNIKEILSSLGLYNGVFYVTPNDANFNLLNLNLENVYQDVAKLNKQDHGENDWAYDNDEFQKVYVLKYDGKNAIVALTYKDSWTPIIIDTINTENIQLEGNIASRL